MNLSGSDNNNGYIRGNGVTLTNANTYLAPTNVTAGRMTASEVTVDERDQLARRFEEDRDRLGITTELARARTELAERIEYVVFGQFVS